MVYNSSIVCRKMKLCSTIISFNLFLTLILFEAPIIPYGYHAQVIHGFVEELVVNDDPEYQWIDKIRTPRASNEARQVVFLKLSAQVKNFNKKKI